MPDPRRRKIRHGENVGSARDWTRKASRSTTLSKRRTSIQKRSGVSSRLLLNYSRNSKPNNCASTNGATKKQHETLCDRRSSTSYIATTPDSPSPIRTTRSKRKQRASSSTCSTHTPRSRRRSTPFPQGKQEGIAPILAAEDKDISLEVAFPCAACLSRISL